MTQRLHGLTLAALAATVGWAGGASAQSAGSVLLRGGFTQIRPAVTSGDLSAPSFAGTQVDVKAAAQLSGGVTYFVTDRLALDLPLALPFRHDITGAGALEGVGKIGDVKALPVTLLVQYRFGAAAAPWRPYLGAGLTYAYFHGARGTAALSAMTGGDASHPTGLTVQSKWAPTVQAGVSVALAPRWGIDAAVLKTPLKTRNTLSTGQSVDTRLDPLTLSVGIAYKY